MITSRGLLTDAQINANQAAAGGQPPPVVANSMTHADYVKYLYEILLGRVADASGMSTWTTALDTGSTTRLQVQVAFLNSNEYRTHRLATGDYTPASTMNAMSNTYFVTYAYAVLLGRDPDASGLAAYVNALQTGTMRGDVVEALISSNEDKTRHGLSLSRLRTGPLARPRLFRGDGRRPGRPPSPRNTLSRPRPPGLLSRCGYLAACPRPPHSTCLEKTRSTGPSHGGTTRGRLPPIGE